MEYEILINTVLMNIAEKISFLNVLQ